MSKREEEDTDESKDGKYINYCEIFVLVESVSQSRERYTLTVFKKSLAIQLTEGHKATYALEHI